MSEICLVFTYKREELLWLCLEAIRREDSTLRVCVFSDRGYQSAEQTKCCETFNAEAFLTIHWPLPASYGNSKNVLDGCKYAVTLNPEIVHLVEDDTIVHRGWFDWARLQLHDQPLAAVCARIPADPPTTWYESPCVSWNASALAECLKLIPPGYLECETREEMQKIISNHEPFKKSKYRFGCCEQDGFYLRCIEYLGLKTKYPPKPLATTLGWWGYNRQGHQGPTGTFEERITACRKALRDRQFRNEMFGERITSKEMEAWDGST